MRLAHVALTAVLTCAFFALSPISVSSTNAQSTPLSVTAVQVQRDSISEPIFGSGSIEATRTTDLAPRVDGVIDRIYVKVGDRVTKGDPLFRTRQIDYEIAEEELTHRLALAEAELDNAKRELDRSQELSAKGVVTNSRLDQQTTLVSTAQARVGIARTQLQRAQQALADTIVRAPYDAVIVNRSVDEGTFMRTMSSSSGSMRGTSGVVTVQEIKVAVAIVHVPETNLRHLALGLPAKVTVDGIGQTYDSEIYILNDRVDPQDRTVELRLLLRNDDYAIKPGLFATARIFPPAQNLLTLPRKVVMGTSSNRYVMVIKGSTVEQRPVTTRDIDTARVEILSGLTAGDIVAGGPNAAILQDGSAITVSGGSN